LNQWILAHRGEWGEQVIANSTQSLKNAFLHGYGVETDIRDLDGVLVISHDPCKGSEYDGFDKFLRKENRIAINIKSDGLVPLLESARDLINTSKSFVFDCSFPELLKFKHAGIDHAIRISEFEKELSWEPNYIWLDAFESDWWLNDKTTLDLIGKIPTVVVSPELHKRDHSKVWQRVLELRSTGLDISVCTDFPNQLAALAETK
jgi:glycerophosphoryl diester phosphodiesterase